MINCGLLLMNSTSPTYWQLSICHEGHSGLQVCSSQISSSHSANPSPALNTTAQTASADTLLHFLYQDVKKICAVGWKQENKDAVLFYKGGDCSGDLPFEIVHDHKSCFVTNAFLHLLS